VAAANGVGQPVAVSAAVGGPKRSAVSDARALQLDKRAEAVVVAVAP